MCLWLSPTPGHRNIRVYCIVDVPPRYFTVFHFLYCVRLRAREYCRERDQLRKSVIVFDFLRFIFFSPFQSYCDTASSKIQYCSHPIFHYWPVIRSCQQILLNRSIWSNVVARIKYCHERIKYCHERIRYWAEIGNCRGFSESNLSALSCLASARFPINLIQFGYKSDIIVIQFWYNPVFDTIETSPPVPEGARYSFGKSWKMSQSPSLHLTQYFICSYRRNKID